MNSFPPLSLAWFIYVWFLALLPILTGPRTPSLLTCFPFPLHPTAWILCQRRECRVTALLFVGFPRFNVISGCLGRRLGEGDRLTSPLILFRVPGSVAARCVTSSAADCPVTGDLALGEKSAFCTWTAPSPVSPQSFPLGFSHPVCLWQKNKKKRKSGLASWFLSYLAWKTGTE